MSRPAEFWHGTHVSFKPGDIITPRDSRDGASNFEVSDPNDKTGWNAGNRAYATDSVEIAEWYAQRAAKKHGEGRVYKVEPVDPSDLEEDKYGGGFDKPAYQSPSGFRVVSEHRSGVCRKCYTLRNTEGNCACPDNSQ